MPGSRSDFRVRSGNPTCIGLGRLSAGWPDRVPPHDAPWRTRPAPRCPRARRGPLSRPHPVSARHREPPLIRPAGDARRYRIIVRSECSSLLASLVDNVQVDMSPGTGDTCVVALVRDDPEFWGLMEQLRDLALHVVSVQEFDHGDSQSSVSPVRESQRAQVALQQW